MAAPWEKYAAPPAATRTEGPWSKYAAPAQPAQAAASEAAPSQPTMMQGVGEYLGGVAQGLYRVPQSAVELGARGLDAAGVTDEAFPTVRSAFETGNRIGNPNQDSKYTKTGDVVGQMIGTAPLSAVRIAQGAGYVPAIVNAATQGAGAAALTSSASDRPLSEQVATGAVVGGVAGAAAKGLGNAATKLLGKRAATPTTDQLHASSKAAYKQADESGVILARDSWRGLVSDIKAALADEAFHPGLQPRSAVAFGELDKVDDNITLKGAEQMRRLVSAAAKSNEPDDRRVAYLIRDKIDDFLSNVSDRDLIGGDASAVGVLKKARADWSKMSKSELVESLADRAGIRAGQFSGSGYENALRTEFRQLALSEKKMRMFSGAEREAIGKVAKGGPIGNAMRFVGKFAPRGVVSAAAGHLLGTATGIPGGGVGAMALGEAGRFGATAATQRNVEMAAEMMRRGGTPAVTPSGLSISANELLKLPPSAAVTGLNAYGRKR